MAATQPYLAFDTLGFAQKLIACGVEREQAEQLAVAARDCVIGGGVNNPAAMDEVARLYLAIIKSNPNFKM